MGFSTFHNLRVLHFWFSPPFRCLPSFGFFLLLVCPLFLEVSLSPLWDFSSFLVFRALGFVPSPPFPFSRFSGLSHFSFEEVPGFPLLWFFPLFGVSPFLGGGSERGVLPVLLFFFLSPLSDFPFPTFGLPPPLGFSTLSRIFPFTPLGCFSLLGCFFPSGELPTKPVAEPVAEPVANGLSHLARVWGQSPPQARTCLTFFKLCLWFGTNYRRKASQTAAGALRDILICTSLAF